MTRTTKVVLIIISVLLVTPFAANLIVKAAPQCTVDIGSFAGSQIEQTCTCIGYEYFTHWESGADSKCIGYVSSRIIID